jgi:hypothetical protein
VCVSFRESNTWFYNRTGVPLIRGTHLTDTPLTVSPEIFTVTDHSDHYGTGRALERQKGGGLVARSVSYTRGRDRQITTAADSDPTYSMERQPCPNPAPSMTRLVKGFGGGGMRALLAPNQVL